VSNILIDRGLQMLLRVLEPEVMDTPDEAFDYNQMDHSEVNRLFVNDFLLALSSAAPSPPSNGLWRVFDAGTGTALIPIELVRRGLDAVVTASDLAEQMLIVAGQNVRAAAMDASIELVQRDCKRLPEAGATFDAVISNSIVHHIPEPRQIFVELWRVLKPGGLLFLRDLLRPDDVSAVEHLVMTYAGNANSHQQQMLRESLCAALTLAEVRAIVVELGLPPQVVQTTSDRHWTVRACKDAVGR
jgi:2-polyprenyl-3-methyl-5-hydroxy-6-metoxy-1,4-benzoquinol methylase